MHLAENVVVAGRFRLLRELGRGGMGTVWLAHHTELEIPCAVKFVGSTNHLQSEMRERFAREAKAAARIRSPHVVQILDHGIWDEGPYIAMEYLEGEDLGQRLERLGRLPPHEMYNFTAQICRALSKAHSLGVIHRDLKPENIFLVPDGDRELVKVLDFGIAKVDHNTITGRNSKTQTGMLLGSPYYMSPEQAQGIRELDRRSDLWSLAVIVFECTLGKRPFESEALGDLLMKIMHEPLPVPSQVCPDVPAAFDAWWAQAAARNVEERFDNAHAFSESLAKALGVSSSSISLFPVTSSGKPPPAVVPYRDDRPSPVKKGKGSLLASTTERSGGAARTLIEVPPAALHGRQKARFNPSLVLSLALLGVALVGGLVAFSSRSDRGSASSGDPAAAAVPAVPVGALPLQTPEPVVASSAPEPGFSSPSPNRSNANRSNSSILGASSTQAKAHGHNGVFASSSSAANSPTKEPKDRAQKPTPQLQSASKQGVPESRDIGF